MYTAFLILAMCAALWVVRECVSVHGAWHAVCSKFLWDVYGGRRFK